VLRSKRIQSQYQAVEEEGASRREINEGPGPRRRVGHWPADGEAQRIEAAELKGEAPLPGLNR
jgi:hypothetical protein